MSDKKKSIQQSEQIVNSNNSSNSKSDKKYYTFLFFLLLINFFWFLGTTVSDILLDELISDIGGSYEVVKDKIQNLDSVFHYTTAVCVIVFGILVDKNPEKRRLYLISINLLWITFNFLIYFLNINLTLYLIMQIIWGISMGAHGPIIFSYLGDLFRINYRGRLFSLFAVVLYFIKGAQNVVTGIVGGAVDSWKLPLFIMAIGGSISIVIFAIKGKDIEPKIAQIEPEFQESIENGKSYNYRLNIADIMQIITRKSNLLFIIQGFFGMMGVTLVSRYMYYWLTSESDKGGMNMNEIVAAFLLFAGAAIGALIGILFSGRWADAQFKDKRLDKILYFPIICLFGEILCYALLVYLPSYPKTVDHEIDSLFTFLGEYPTFWLFILIFNFAIFFGTGIGPIVGMTRTHLNLPEHRGSVAALYDTADFFGAGVGLMLGNIIYNIIESNLEMIFYGSLFWLISAIIWIFILKYINDDYSNIRKIMKERQETQ